MKIKNIFPFLVGLSIFLLVSATDATSIKLKSLSGKVKYQQSIKTAWPDMQIKVFTTQKKDKTWNWSCIVKNNGPKLQAKQVQIRATQLSAAYPIAEAGPTIRYSNAIKNGQIMNIGRQGWHRRGAATHLKVEIKDLQSGRLKSKIISFPKQNRRFKS